MVNAKNMIPAAIRYMPILCGRHMLYAAVTSVLPFISELSINPLLMITSPVMEQVRIVVTNTLVMERRPCLTPEFVFAAAATGEFGAFNVVGAYEYTNRSAADRQVVRKDAQTIYLGGNYDCGFAKTFVLAQYFEGASAAAGFDIKTEFKNTTDEYYASAKGLKGYGLHVGTQVPVMAGTLTAAVYYVDGKLEGVKNAGETGPQKDNDVSYIGASARYVYALSKRTEVYLGGGVAQAKIDEWNTNESDRKTFIGQAYTGLTHRF